VEALKKKFEAAPAITALEVGGANGVLLVGLANGVVQVRAASEGGLVAVFGERREKGGVRSVRAKGNALRAHCTDGVVWAWDSAQKWELEKVLGSVNDPVLVRDRVLTLAFSDDGGMLAAGTGDPSREGELLVWKTSALEAPPKRMNGVHSDTILSLAFSPDGKMLVSGGADKVARIVNLETLKVERSLEGHTHHVLGVAWSPDGRSIVTAGADNVLKVWEAATGVRKKNVDGADKEVTAVQFLSGGSQFVAASGDGKVRVVGTNGTVVRLMTEGTVFFNSMHASKNGRVVFAGGQDGVLRVWNPQDGAKLAEFKAESK
jgi:WD40 repeat protein